MIHTSMNKPNMNINDSSGIKLPPDNRIHLFDPVGLINENYGGYNIIKQRRPTKSYDDAGFSLSTTTTSSTTNIGGRRGLAAAADAFDINMTDDEDDEKESNSTTVTSQSHPSHNKSNYSPKPPAAPTTILSSPPRPLQPNNNHHHMVQQNLSPKSRTQAIAKGRKEMMDMIKDMPESFYELSLKDMVVVDQHNKLPPTTTDLDHLQVQQKLHDHNNNHKAVKETRFANNDQEAAEKPKVDNYKKNKKMKKSESRIKMVRSASLDHNYSGFLLKTSVFPNITLGLSKKNKKKSINLSASASFNVAPPMKDTDHNKDWWRKKSCISSKDIGDSRAGGLTEDNNSRGGGGGSSGGSSRSNSSNSRNKHNKRFLPCFSIFDGKKIKPGK